MHFSGSSILNVTMLSGISMLFLWLMLRFQFLINRISFNFAFFCLFLLFLRIFIPLEYAFTHSIYDLCILPIIQDFFYYPLFSLQGQPVRIFHLLFALWLVGSIVILIRQVYQYLQFQRFVKSLPAVQDSRIESILARITDTMDKKKEFRILQTESVHSPLIIGFHKYDILLPKVSLSDEELTFILTHEIMHAYRGDLWIKSFVNLLSILYWWNPFIYLLEKEIDKLLEFRADYFVIQKIEHEVDRTVYADCLLHIAKEQGSYPSIPGSLSFLGHTKFALSQRIYFILGKTTRKLHLLSYAILIPFLLLVMLSYSIILEPTRPMDPKQKEEGSFELTPETAYFIRISDNEYHLYLEGKYVGTTPTYDIGVELPVYESEDDVP